MNALAGLLYLGIIALIALLIAHQHRDTSIPVVQSAFLTVDQIPLVAPCITPAPPEREA